MQMGKVFFTGADRSERDSNSPTFASQASFPYAFLRMSVVSSTSGTGACFATTSRYLLYFSVICPSSESTAS